MSEFEFYLSFFGLLLGLTIAEVATKLADAIGERRRVSLGVLTPLLATFLLFDVSGFWLWMWSARDTLAVTWPMILGGLVVAITYFLSAALVFPRHAGEWTSLDEYYWEHKRLVVGGVLVANLIVLAFQLMRVLPAWTDVWFFVWQASYFLPLTALMLVRSRRANVALLCCMVLQFSTSIFPIFPNSEWGDKVGLNGDSARAASTTAPAAPR